MQKRIYIHVGPPKTGTSAIQYWLSKNHKFLKKNQVLYPLHDIPAGGISSGNLREIYDVLADGELKLAKHRVQSLLKEFERGPYSILLLSSEFFSNRLDELKECFKQAKFIFYVRNPIEVRESNYNQSVKRHKQKEVLKLSDSCHLPHLEKLALFASQHGSECIITRFYGEKFFKNGCLIQDFLSVLNLDSNVKRSLINTSYQFEALEFKRWINHYPLQTLQVKIDQALQQFRLGTSSYSLFDKEEYLFQVAIFMKAMVPLLECVGANEYKLFFDDMEGKKLPPKKVQKLDENSFLIVVSFLSKEMKRDFKLMVESILSYKKHPDSELIELLNTYYFNHPQKNKLPRWLAYDGLNKIFTRNIVLLVKTRFFLLRKQLLSKFSTLPNMIKIKLVAVAKNEAAYLPEWIFHHLYFGFDEIHIYLNGTTDNTYELAKHLNSHKQIFFHEGDSFYSQDVKSPQNVVYKHELEKSYREGFTHVMFLDIDEFWVSKSFNISITEYAEKNNSDVNSFEWLNRINEQELFSLPIQQELIGIKTSQIKSLIKTGLNIKAVNPHSVLVDNASYQLADGKIFKPEKGKIRAPLDELQNRIKDYFVLHRMYRSQMEYVAMLSTPIAIKSATNSKIFKDNRSGYCTDYYTDIVRLPKEEHDAYSREYQKFIEKYRFNPLILTARKFIEDKYIFTTNLIQNAPVVEAVLLKRILKNVTLEAVIKSYDNFKNRQGLSD